MKNTKLSKIILLALSVAVLVGCALAFSVSAAEEENDGIVLKNLYYDEKVAILFAVDATVGQAENGDVTVEYYWDDATDDVKQATYYPDDGTLGTDYPVFITEGLAAKELGKLAHVTFTDASGAKHEETYSVAEYLYKRLYVDGFAAKTEADGKDYNRKLLYQNLLNYGEQAQLVFDYKTDKLLNNYSIAYTTSELINLAGKSYVFGHGAISVEGTVIGEGTIAGWTVTDLVNGGSSESENVVLSLTGAYQVEPIFGVHECLDEDNDHLCDSCGEVASTCVNANNTVDHKCDICGKVVDACADGDDEDSRCDVCGVYSFTEGVIYNSSDFTTTIKDAGGEWVGGSAAYNEYLAGGTQYVGTTNMLNQNGIYMDVINDPYNTSVENKVLRVVSRMVGSKNSYIDVKVEKLGNNNDVLEFTFDYMFDYQNYKSANFNMAYVTLWNSESGRHTDDTSGVNRNQNRGFILRSEVTSSTGSADAWGLDTNTMLTQKQDSSGSFAAADPSTEAILNSHTWYKVKLIVSGGIMYRYYSADAGNTWNFISKSGASSSAFEFTSDLDVATIQILSWNNTTRFYLDNMSFVAVDAPSIELPTN